LPDIAPKLTGSASSSRLVGAAMNAPVASGARRATRLRSVVRTPRSDISSRLAILTIAKPPPKPSTTRRSRAARSGPAARERSPTGLMGEPRSSDNGGLDVVFE
jgi:hypothetical protein